MVRRQGNLMRVAVAVQVTVNSTIRELPAFILPDSFYAVG